MAYSCVRGTNDVKAQKGYRRYLRTLLTRYCASWALARSVLQKFNVRGNLRMIVKNRGSPVALRGHCIEYHVELIQRATDGLAPELPNPRPEWPAAIDSVAQWARARRVGSPGAYRRKRPTGGREFPRRRGVAC
ncbi:unnamed protein product [Ectocarpus sp. 13 AM-2016]